MSSHVATSTPAALEGAAELIPELAPVVGGVVLVVLGLSFAYQRGRSVERRLSSSSSADRGTPYTPNELTAIVGEPGEWCLAVDLVDGGAVITEIEPTSAFSSGWRELERLYVAREELLDLASALELVEDRLDDRDALTGDHREQLEELGVHHDRDELEVGSP